ncbi:hypothetical protein GUJ93_ZPchr0011g28531 [Zizania palustris]|uniref:Protein kinase domain-containing protein n=1 Tax=Zizania palustris TaxID=103762 RepID=A0A8J5WL42_ZIZPA|nr:hypothetical protein GUJ93_ZPchr0011g28531 [Zizania palustris]
MARYNFSRQDFGYNGSKSFVDSDGLSIRTVFDWAIRSNGSCSLAKTAPACVSNHSECIDATNGEGYLCKCSAGYAGNPYVTGDGGCTNINECELRKEDPAKYEKLYPCYRGSICHDTEGDYECKCPKFHRGDGKITDNNLKGCHPIISTATIATVAVAIVGIFVCVAVPCVLMRHKKHQRSRSFDKNGGNLLKEITGIKFFSEEELKKMTKNYQKVLGEGHFGKVYKGIINDEEHVAVKRYIRKDEKELYNEQEIAGEITNQAQIQHTNLLRLIGCCLHTDVPMLVLEFIPKGNLDDVLHGADRHLHKISLSDRLRIAIGCAEALTYMHSDSEQHKSIVHGDVKSGNILLNDNLEPKVSDFGSAKLRSIANSRKWVVKADRAYVDPVYQNNGIFTEKSDVYSFGVVLLELITRKKPLYDDSKNLPYEFVNHYEDGNARTMYDRDLASTNNYLECLDRIAGIAVRCLKNRREKRPTMKEVLDELKQLEIEQPQLPA